MFPRAATRDAARVLGHDYGAGDRLAKLIPDPIMGRPPSFEDCLKPRRAAARRGRRGPEGQADRRGGPGPGGDRAQLLDPRRRGGDRRPAADRHRPAAARRRRRGGENGEKVYRTVTQFSMKPIEEIGLLKMDFLGLRNLDVIEDALDIIERSTGERPDMTTLPLDDAHDLRDARPRRLGRRVPVRVRGHARGAQEGPPDRVRRPRRARRALPPGRDGPDPDLRPRQARPGVDHLPRRAAAPDPRGRPRA